MYGYPYRVQTGWVTLLALAWLWLCSPWAHAWNAMAAILTFIGGMAAIVVTTHRLRMRRNATTQVLSAMDGTFNALPGDLKRNTPLVLAVGSPGTLACAFGDDSVRITDAAIWVRCDAPETLIHHVDALKRWRSGLHPDAVLLMVAADQEDPNLPLGMALRRWRSAIGAAERTIGAALPVGVAVYMAENREDAEPCLWFGVSGPNNLCAHALEEALTTRLARHACEPASAGAEARAQRASLLAALTAWTSCSVLPVLSDSRQDSSPLRVMAWGVTAVPGAPDSRAPFGEFMADVTGLSRGPSVGRRPGSFPLPNALLRGMPRRPVDSVIAHALAHAALWLAIFTSAGMLASAVHNRALLERVTANIRQYQLLSEDQGAERVKALAWIKRDRNELQWYATTGVPARLGFGLYRGASWLPTLDQLIASYRPPVTFLMLELDDLSLFKSGSAILSSGSNRTLIRALNMIKAHPGRRVLISGHADNIGDANANLRLSTARAEAVRDWLVDASGMSPTRFAIQGYGDTRPKASNDTAAGRALNRRVEITLIPDCRNDAGNRFNQGRVACS